MTLVDTSHLTALISSRDSLHQRARAWNSYLGKQSLLLTEYVLLETLNTLSHPAVRQRVHALLDELRLDSRVIIVPAAAELWEAGLRMHRQQADKEWSLTDCISFYVMRRRLTRALTHEPPF